jgi:hypothetical protein
MFSTKKRGQMLKTCLLAEEFEEHSLIHILTLSHLGAPLVHRLAFSAHISLKNGLIRMI